MLSRVWLFVIPWTVACSGSSVHGLFQARIPEWIAISSSRGSSLPRDQTPVSCISRRILYHCATWEAPCKHIQQVKQKNQNKTAIFLDSVLLFQHVATGSSLHPLSINKSKTWWYVTQLHPPPPHPAVGTWQNESVAQSPLSECQKQCLHISSSVCVPKSVFHLEEKPTLNYIIILALILLPLQFLKLWINLIWVT